MRTVLELPEHFTNTNSLHKEEPNSSSAQAPSLFLPSHNFLRPEYQWLEKMTLAKEVDDAQHIMVSPPCTEQKQKKSVSHHYCLCFVIKLSPLPLQSMSCDGQSQRHSYFIESRTSIPVITADQPLYALTKQIVLIFELEDCILKCIW